ncbi:uncharacterized protein BDV14DRAFT_158815 [Aspergillus stella-maris]|uniref:uncharacterized protein n=1 Tax=Aspergillus stella-maris TaxID=1810926 RepID=UPI003CCCCFCC
MGWSQVAVHRWERPLEGAEGIMAIMSIPSSSTCDDLQHYTAFSRIKLEWSTLPTDLESRIRQAWLQLRHEQPEIATTVNGFTKVYEVPVGSMLQLWLDSTFVVSSAASADDVYRTVESVKQVTLYYIPRSSELLLRAPVYVMDGIGMLMLWDRLLKLLVKPTGRKIEFGSEPKRLAPTLASVLGRLFRPTEDQEDNTMTAIEEYFQKLAPPSDPTTSNPIQHQMSGKRCNSTLVLSAQSTSALVNACRSIGITVTSAMHAALIEVWSRASPAPQNQPPSSQEYVTWLTFDLRKYLPKPFNTTDYAASYCLGHMPWNIALPAPFIDIAQDLNESYRNTFRDDSQFIRLVPHFDQIAFNARRTALAQGFAIPRTTAINSIGVVDRYIQHTYGDIVTVQDVALNCDVDIGPSFFTIWTFRDQLRIADYFDDGIETRSNVDSFLDAVLDVLSSKMLNGAAIEVSKTSI